MNHKHRAIVSSYSDIHKISYNVKCVHFRKFISKKVLKIILERCPHLVEVSVSKYASERLNPEIMKLIRSNNLELRVSSERGRPSYLEIRNINVIHKLIRSDLSG